MRKPPSKEPHPGCKAVLAARIHQYNHDRADPNRKGSVSDKTRAARANNLHLCFEQLDELGYKMQNPDAIDNRRVTALVAHWVSKGELVSNIEQKLSALRIFCGWIGKRSLILRANDYSPGLGKRDRNTTRDRRPSAKNLDIALLIGRAIDEDPAFGAMLWLEHSCGLRRLEAIMLNPLVSHEGTTLFITNGSKGGRPRRVPITSENQRAALAFAKWVIDKSKSLGHAMRRANRRSVIERHLPVDEDSLKKAVARYQNLMTKLGYTAKDFGFTGHDLRAAYAIETLAEQGFAAPVMSLEEAISRGLKPLGRSTEASVAILEVMEAMGHGRGGVGGAYYGKINSIVALSAGPAIREIP